MPDQITTEHAYALGYVEGLASPNDFTTGITWNDADLNEAYDRGVNAGQASERMRQVSGTVEAKFLPAVTVTVTDGKVVGVECDMGDAYQEAHAITEGTEGDLLDGEEPRAKTAIAFMDAHVDTVEQFFISLHREG